MCIFQEIVKSSPNKLKLSDDGLIKQFQYIHNSYENLNELAFFDRVGKGG